MVEQSKDNKKNQKLKPWLLFSLCSKLTTDAVNDAPSLAQYLEAERRASSTNRRTNQCATTYAPNDFSPVQDSNSFVGDQVALQSSASLGGDDEKEQNSELEQNNVYGNPIVFSCLCG